VVTQSGFWLCVTKGAAFTDASRFLCTATPDYFCGVAPKGFDVAPHWIWEGWRKGGGDLRHLNLTSCPYRIFLMPTFAYQMLHGNVFCPICPLSSL